MTAGMVADVFTAARTERKALTTELLPDLPDEVLELTRCEVSYTINPAALPYSPIAFSELREALKQEYGLSFIAPDVNKLGPLIGDLPGLEADAIGQALLKHPKTGLTFDGGLLKISESDAVAVRRVDFSYERVDVAIVGPTRAGEQLAMELVRLLWALVGVSKSWEQCQPSLQLVRFGTATRVRFDAALPFLAPPLLQALGSWAKPEGLASWMGAQSAGGTTNFWTPTITYSLDELHLLFYKDGPGSHETSKLRIGVDVESDYGKGIFTVSSELPFPEHLELIASLRDAVQAG